MADDTTRPIRVKRLGSLERTRYHPSRRPMPIERYTPYTYPEVESSARKLKWFRYVKEIIKWHTEDRLPGSCWV